MRKVEFTVYEFEELSDKAKEAAINNLREDVYIQSCEFDNFEIQETFSKIQEITGVRADIRCSSQGPYVWSANEIVENYDLTEEELFNNMLAKVKEWETEYPFEDWAKDIFENATFDDRRSYALNVGWLMVQVYKKIDDAQLYYYEDGYVKEYLIDNNFLFFEDGSKYSLKY